MKKKSLCLTVAIISTILALIIVSVIVANAGRVEKSKIRYKCFRDGIRIPCPENFKESPEFRQYQREKKAGHHDTRRHYMDNEQISTERTYYDDSIRTYYDESIREEAEND